MKSKALIEFVIALMLIVLNGRSFAQNSCFPLGYAYMNWHTLIREQPVLWSRAISLDKAGFLIRVQDTKRVYGNCWVQAPLNTGQARVGWLLAENVTALRIPTINGDERFNGQIIMGFNYLLEKAPRWFQYVTQPDYIIEPAKPRDTKSHMDWPARIVRVHEEAFVSQLKLASHLVHEACHIHQGIEERLPLNENETYVRVRIEQECVAREVEMMEDIDPEHDDVRERRNVLARPFGWWVRDVASSASSPAPVRTSRFPIPPSSRLDFIRLSNS